MYQRLKVMGGADRDVRSDCDHTFGRTLDMWHKLQCTLSGRKLCSWMRVHTQSLGLGVSKNRKGLVIHTCPGAPVRPR
jgi:hypothetical protein